MKQSLESFSHAPGNEVRIYTYLLVYSSNKLCTIPYSTKFSRHIIFAVFADWPQTVKIKLMECFVIYACIRRMLGPRN